MEKMGTHYETLQIPAEASRQKIRAAYFRLADIHHPDRGGDSSTFTAVQAAYQVLSDPGRRAAYDETLTPPADADRHGTEAGTPPQSGPQSGESADEDDVFVPDWLYRLSPEKIDEDSSSKVKVVPGRWDELLRIGTAAALAAAAVGLGYQRLDSTTWWLWAWLALWVGAATWGCVAAACAHLGGKLAVGVIAAAIPLLIGSPLAGVVWLLCFIGFGFSTALRSARGFTVTKVRSHNARTVSDLPEAITALVLIPAVRIIEDPIRPGSRFIVTCGENVALIGHPLGSLQESKLRMAGATVRRWPLEVTADADHCLDEVGEWLLTNTDGWTVNRRVLAASTHTFWPK